jgi:excisionase family DNA binding protein
MIADALLTVAEAAERLGLAQSTIRDWIAKRRLTFVRCGRAVRIPAEAVERFIATNTVSAQGPR